MAALLAQRPPGLLKTLRERDNGVNVQVLTDPAGELLWISPALPAAPTASSGSASARAKAPVERGMARLKSWQIFRRSRISPNRMTVITKAVLTLERQR